MSIVALTQCPAWGHAGVTSDRPASLKYVLISACVGAGSASGLVPEGLWTLSATLGVRLETEVELAQKNRHRKRVAAPGPGEGALAPQSERTQLGAPGWLSH